MVVVVAAAGLIMASQGWRSLLPNFDAIPDILSARALVDEGRIPDRGLLSSFLSYVPPGAAWLAVPGVLMGADMRLVTLPGSALLHVVTIAGVFCLTRRHFGWWPAVSAVVLYGLSPHAVTYAASYGPRGYLACFIWMAYLVGEWVARRDGRFLAAAIAVWAAGMYLFLELAPALLALPVVWYRYRPPVRWQPLAAACVLASVMWFPYLRFEAGRGFADLRSQLFMQHLTPPRPVEGGWCDPALVVRRVGPEDEGLSAADSRVTSTRTIAAIGRRVLSAVRGLLVNGEGLVAGPELALFGLTALGLAAYLGGARSRSASPSAGERRPWRWIAALGVILGAVFVADVALRVRLGDAATFTSYTRQSVLDVELVLLSGIVALVARPAIARIRAGVTRAAGPDRDALGALAVALAVPWAILLILAEHGRDERLSFLWPLQVVLSTGVAAAVWRLGAGSVRVRRAGLAAGALVAVNLAAAPAAEFLAAARDAGWAGRDAIEIDVARRLGGLVRASGRTQAAIGYHIAVSRTWGSRFAAVDPRYKIGTEFDLVLTSTSGVTNTSRCAEGVSPDDEYRVIATSMASDEPREYVDVPADPRFHLVEVVGPYQLLKRD